MTSSIGRLTVRRADFLGIEVGSVKRNETIRGLRENTEYHLSFETDTDFEVIVDDVVLLRSSKASFLWKAEFYAGTVKVLVSSSTINEIYYLQVEPPLEKLKATQLEGMVSEIRCFDEALLLGETAASMEFGNQGSRTRLSPWIRWQRIQDYGRDFVELVEHIAKNPHSTFSSTAQSLPLSKIRRLPVSSLRDRRIATLATGGGRFDEDFGALRIQSHAAALTLDTPANQTLSSLLFRFRHTLNQTIDWLNSNNLADNSGRRQYRISVLRELEARVVALFQRPPFSTFARGRATSGGLTQVASIPAYARAYRKGTEALRNGISDSTRRAPLRVSPSWGLYETWCLITLSNELSREFSCDFSKVKSGMASADLILQASLRDGRVLQLLFQAVFPSLGLERKSDVWSISGERRPDIVIAVFEQGGWRYLILDAKYRSGKSNLLDGMTSAHIYNDSLFVGHRRPEFCLILHPGESSLLSLENEETWRKYGVGSIGEFSLGEKGVQRCIRQIIGWVTEEM